MTIAVAVAAGEPNGVVTFAGFEEHATVDESFVRFEGRWLEQLRRLGDGMFGKPREGAPGEAGPTKFRAASRKRRCLRAALHWR
jgi:hypothetical protein